MLSAIEVKGFQSLVDVRVDLGGLTVVEGPSNSGKSALIRAFVLLARNARGTSYVTTGKATCTVATGSDDENWVLRLTRTTRRGGDEYRLRFAEVPAAEVFTKLAGGVPDQVTGVLRIGPLNIARQFDPPYLLTESGRDVADTLGRLTNVSMVLAAAAEAGRRRKRIAQDLKGAEGRRDALLEQAQEFAGLPGQRKAIARAEQALAALQETESSLARLRALTSRMAEAEQAVAEAAQAVARAAPPPLEALDAILARVDRLRELEEAYCLAVDGVALYRSQARVAELAEEDAHRDLHKALVAAGTCPTCGSIISA